MEKGLLKKKMHLPKPETKALYNANGKSIATEFKNYILKDGYRPIK